MAICKLCKDEKSITEMTLFDEDLVCNDCYSTLKPEKVNEEINDCVLCGGHLNKQDYEVYSNQNYCSECYHKSLHLEIPLWVKVFALLIVFIPLSGLYVNSKYFYAISAMRNATKSFVGGKIQDSITFIEDALSKLPNNSELKSRKNFYSGISFYQNGDTVNALIELKQYLNYYPDDTYTRNMASYLELGIAFDKQDYLKMYNISVEIEKNNPDDPMSKLQVASSLACLYVDKNNDSYKTESLLRVKSVETVIKDYPEEVRKEYLDYIERINHRILTKKIISREEYIANINGGE